MAQAANDTRPQTFAQDRYVADLLPNGCILWQDRRSGLTGLMAGNGRHMHGDLNVPARYARAAMRVLLGRQPTF